MSKPTARWIEYWTARLSALIENEITQVKTENAASLDAIDAAAKKQALKELGVQKQYERIIDLVESAKEVAAEINELQKDASKTVAKIDGRKNSRDRYGYHQTRTLSDFAVGFGHYGSTLVTNWLDWGAISTAYDRAHTTELKKTPWGLRIVTLEDEKLRINDTIMLSASDAELRDKIKSILTHLGIPTTELQDALDG